MPSLRLTGIGLALTGAAACHASNPLQWLNREMVQRIQITGYRQFGYHSHSVTGDRLAFESLTYFGQGSRRFTDTGNLTFTGRNVLGLFNFDMQIQDSRFQDPQGQRISLNYNRGPWAVDAGDIQGSLLNTNAFASMSKSMKGISAQFKSGRFAVKALRSDTKGSARTIAIQGNNSTGPYYLQTSQIIADSELVQVDGREMVLGKDYVISYEIGAITFIDRLIAPTSTILVSYEALGFNTAPGLVQGVGASYNFGKFGQIGVTHMEQKSRSGGGLSSRLEQFQGFGAPSTPYFLQFEPLDTRPVVVRVDGIVQREFIDYTFDALNRSIFYFRRFMPATANIEVIYTPRPTGTVDGDRRVLGFDYRLPFGKGNQSYVQYSQATGSLLSDATPLRGTARGISGLLKSGPYRFAASWRDVPDSFVSVESRSFNRNEKAIDLALDYEAKGLTYGAGHRNSSVTLRSVSSKGETTFSPGRQTHSRLHVGSSSEEGSGWRLEQTRATSRSLSGESKLDTTSATASRTLGKVKTRLGLEHQAGYGPSGFAANSPTTNVALDTVRLEADYKPSDPWIIGLRTSFSKIRSDDQSGSGRDISMDLGYQPSEKLSVTASYTDSNAGQLATLGGFNSGFGLGYDGNGFSGGATGNTFANGSNNLRLLQLRTRYKATEKLSLDARMYSARSSGSYSSNTDTTSYGLGLDWNLGGGTTLNFSIDQSKTKFLDSPFSSDALTFDAFINGKPAGPWSYRLGASALVSGGRSDFQQSSLYLDGGLTYALNSRQNLSFRFQHGRTTGYLPQQDNFVGMFYEYQLYRNVSLVASYKLRNLANLDPLATSGAYRSRGFDLELSFNFGR
ncbi:MAG TPA: hypothetical protein VEX38_00855 [Fimbriimonadaceae bacterium]|nr:hypothetical protein [Fimbriimonadaceae bacterium]